jgi:hypothetical protein
LELIMPNTFNPVFPVAPGTVIPPIGVPSSDGTLINPIAFSVSTNHLLPPTPPNVLAAMPATAAVRTLTFNANAGSIGLTQNALARRLQPSAPTVQTNPVVGSQGSTGMDGASTIATPVFGPGDAPILSAAAATGALAVDALSAWQLQHPSLDLMARVALPVFAWMLFRRGRPLEAAVVGAPAAVLWYKRLVHQ